MHRFTQKHNAHDKVGSRHGDRYIMFSVSGFLALAFRTHARTHHICQVLSNKTHKHAHELAIHAAELGVLGVGFVSGFGTHAHIHLSHTVHHHPPPPLPLFPGIVLCTHNLSPKNITTNIFLYRTADEQNISPGAHLVTAFPCNYFRKHVVACRSCSYSIASSGLEVDRLLRSRAVVSAVKSA